MLDRGVECADRRVHPEVVDVEQLAEQLAPALSLALFNTNWFPVRLLDSGHLNPLKSATVAWMVVQSRLSLERRADVTAQVCNSCMIYGLDLGVMGLIFCNGLDLGCDACVSRPNRLILNEPFELKHVFFKVVAAEV